MSIFKTSFKVFSGRVQAMRRKYPDRPVRYYARPEGYDLYWTDDDNQVISASIEKTTFRSPEEERQFINDFLAKGQPLEEPYEARESPVIQASATPSVEKEADFLDPIEEKNSAQ